MTPNFHRLAPTALIVAAAWAPFLAPVAAHAQSTPQAPLVIYGNQRCPTNADGNEIVVCVRRNQNEQFRIPRELREFQVTSQNESWASRVVQDQNVAASGIGSCTTSGPGGSTGCFMQQVQADRAANRQRQRDQQQIDDNCTGSDRRPPVRRREDKGMNDACDALH